MAVTEGSGYTSTYLTWNYTGGGPNYRWSYSWSYDDSTKQLTLRIAGEAYTTTTGAQIGMTYRSSGTPWAQFYIDGVRFDYYQARTVAKHTVKGWQEFCSLTRVLDCTNDVTTISIRNYGKAQYNTTGSRTSDSTQTFTIDTPQTVIVIGNVLRKVSGSWKRGRLCRYVNGSWRKGTLHCYRNGEWRK